MAENLAKRPSKGILKSSSSFEKPDAPSKKKHKETKWDEMNIIATLHPADKDYGHMKIEEPKTPFNWALAEGDETDGLDPELLAERIRLGASELPKSLQPESEEEEEEEEEEEIEETPEDKEKRKVFESKRKAHYNEYYAVKLARRLMSQDMDDEDEEEEGNISEDKASTEKMEENSEADCAGPSTRNATEDK